MGEVTRRKPQTALDAGYEIRCHAPGPLLPDDATVSDLRREAAAEAIGIAWFAQLRRLALAPQAYPNRRTRGLPADGYPPLETRRDFT